MKKVLLLVWVMLGVLHMEAQTPLTIEESVMGAYRDFYPENVSNLSWIPNSHAYSFSAEDGGVDQLRLWNVDSKKESTIADTKSLSALLEKNGSNGMESFRRPIWINANEFIMAHEGSFWKYNYKKRKLEKVSEVNTEGENHDPSKDYSKIAFTKGDNLFYSTAGNPIVTVTDHQKPGVVSGKAIHRYEFGIAKGTFWSPESNFLAFYEKDESMVTDYPLLDYSADPALLNPLKYPMAGQSSHQAKVGVYQCATKKLIYLETGALDDHYLTNLTWSPDEKYIYLAEINRDQNHMQLNQYDVSTGKKIATLFEEKDKEYVEPEHGPYFLKNGDGTFLWFSKRDGFNHLYRYDASGKLLNQVTHGDLVIHDILNYQPTSGQLIVSGTHLPTEKFAYQVNVKGGEMHIVTPDPGNHRVQVSDDGRYILDDYMSLKIPRVVTVKDSKGKVVKEILKAEDRLADRKIGTTELFTIKAEDDADLWCRMIKPSDFDPAKKYPVLVYVYGGPHAQMVTDSWLGGASLWMHYMAERGYVIFTLDNHGSGNRGVEFEQKVFRNIGDQELKDQLVGVEYLKSLPYVDPDRMAIHGWSFGGFMTTSMMTRYPDVFKVGVAGGPVIDWSLYEVMYTERYMDTPQTNPDGFEKARVSKYASQLKGDLLLIHGTVDDVVVMQNSMEFLKACIDAGKQVDFFVYPGHPHNVRGKDRVHLMTKVLNYIEDKLDTR